MSQPPFAQSLQLLRRPSILRRFLQKARPEALLLVGLLLFMLFLLEPLANAVLPEPEGPSLFGIKLGRRSTPYDRHSSWLLPLLWGAGLAYVGLRAYRRLPVTLAEARGESERLALEAEAALARGESLRGLTMLQRAAELAVDPERRDALLARLGEAPPARGSSAAPTFLTPRPGALGTIGPGGRIKLLGKLGQGGMGTVFLAEDSVLGRKLAAKELTAGATQDDSVRERFVREARVLAQLSSPHIVQVYDFIEGAGRTFLCMELCEGKDLATALKERGSFRPAESAAIGARIARALAAAHRKGIVHRDLKPANVLYSDDGTVKVADFGLARLRDSGLTQQGTIMGTPAYMAPEQVLGRETDGRADLYSLGCLLFELVTGQQPYVGGLAEVLAQHTSPAPPPDPGARVSLPPELAALIRSLMAKDASARPREAEQVAATLDELAGLEDAEAARPEGTFVRARRATDRSS